MSRYVRRISPTMPPFPAVEGVELRHAVGHPGYAVGSDGSVWTCRRRGAAGFRKEWKKRRLPLWKNNRYLTVSLYDGRGKSVLRKVHHLVLEVFVGPRPSLAHEGRHLDDNQLNNEASNLLWGTPEQNADDAVRNGSRSLLKRGIHHPSAKLTDEQVERIRELRAALPATKIARRFRISEQYVYKLLSGKRRA